MMYHTYILLPCAALIAEMCVSIYLALYGLMKMEKCFQHVFVHIFFDVFRWSCGCIDVRDILVRKGQRL